MCDLFFFCDSVKNITNKSLELKQGVRKIFFISDSKSQDRHQRLLASQTLICIQQCAEHCGYLLAQPGSNSSSACLGEELSLTSSQNHTDMREGNPTKAKHSGTVRIGNSCGAGSCKSHCTRKCGSEHPVLQRRTGRREMGSVLTFSMLGSGSGLASG